MKDERNVRFGSEADIPTIFARCPLYPQKRTWFSAVVMSALCQKRTFGERPASRVLASGESERILCDFGDGLGCESERLCDIGRGSRHAETIDAEGNALIADPTGPAEGCGGFDRHARGHFGR